jgi:hypothetical protein
MTLKELLEYRSKCLIHGLPMEPSYVEISGSHVTLTDDRVNLETDGLNLNFYFDGIFTGNISDPQVITAPQIYNERLIHMICRRCSHQYLRQSNKSRTLGASTISDINVNQHYYTFILRGNNKGSFDGYLSHESVKCVRDGKFYHVDFDLYTKQAVCKMGSCDVKQTLDDLVSKMMNLHVPVFDASRIQNIDTLVEKLKLYNLFS